MWTDPRRIKRIVTRPSGVLAMGVSLSLALMLLPGRGATALRSSMAAVLRPGQRAARRVIEPMEDWLRAHRQQIALRRADESLRKTTVELYAENERLRRALAMATSKEPRADNEPPTLVHGAIVPARVLDGRTRAALAGLVQLDSGARQRLSSGLLAVAEASLPPLRQAIATKGLSQNRLMQGGRSTTKTGIVPNDSGIGRTTAVTSDDATVNQLLDAGENAGLARGLLALDGARVVGRLARVDFESSWLILPSDPKFRDEVAIRSAEGPRSAEVRGVLEGAGPGRCRVRMVEKSRPVAVGDWVVPAGGSGLWDSPPSYGRVISADLHPGGTHWDISVELWPGETPTVVSIVRASLQQASTDRPSTTRGRSDRRR